MSSTPYNILLVDGPCVGAEWLESIEPPHRLVLEHLDGATVGRDQQVLPFELKSVVYERFDYIGLTSYFRFVGEEE